MEINIYKITQTVPVAIIFLVMCLISGCGRDEGSDDVESARVETANNGEISGPITWYTLWGDGETGKLIAAFNKKYPQVKVTAMQFGSSEKTERIRAEFRSGINKVDVISIMFGMFAKPLADDGMLARYTPDSSAEYPPDLSDRIFHDYWTVMAVNPHGICYNTRTIKDPPVSHEDLLDPRFTGQIVMITPLQISGSRNFFVETRGYWGDDKWQAFWRGLAAHDLFFTENAAQGMMLVARGERGVYLYCNTSLFTGEVKKGAPLKWVTAEPNVASEVVIALAEKSDNPVAARAFYNFVMSEHGQSMIGEAFGLQPVHPKAPLPEVVKDAANVPIVYSPSKYQIEQMDGESTRDTTALDYYERFAADIFKLR